MSWSLTLALATLCPHREPAPDSVPGQALHYARLARGLATAHVICKGMARWMWEPLTRDMGRRGFVLSVEGALGQASATYMYLDYGLIIHTDHRRTVTGTNFNPPSN
jgi:hypothetical protein